VAGRPLVAGIVWRPALSLNRPARGAGALHTCWSGRDGNDVLEPAVNRIASGWNRPRTWSGAASSPAALEAERPIHRNLGNAPELRFAPRFPLPAAVARAQGRGVLVEEVMRRWARFTAALCTRALCCRPLPPKPVDWAP